MRKLIVGTFISLDGVMQAPGGPEEDPTGGFRFGGWVFPHWDDATGEKISALFDAPFDLLLGRKTYEIFAAHWPYVEDDPIAERFNAATKFVVTSSAAPLAWHNSVALRGGVPAEIARLKQEDGPNLLVQGSSQLLHALLAGGLVDELHLLTFPLLLGRGKRLFGEDSAPIGLKLVVSRVSGTGVVMASYLPDGEVRTGSFALEQPTEAEIARREKVKMEETA